MNDLRTAFLDKYSKYGNVLDMYERANDRPATWNNLSKIGLSKFVDYMNERLATSSVKTYAAMLKAVLNLYNEEVKLPKDYDRILSVRGETSSNTWLNDSDIDALISYIPESMNERLVRNQFIMGCVTGARHSDYVDFTRENMVNKRLVYVSKKTHIRAEIPLSPVVERLIAENEMFYLSGKEVSDPTFNSIIRNICKKVGMTERLKLYRGGRFVEGEKHEFISSHTARRSFATNLYLRGADLYSISKMMGHKSVTMTEGYVVCGLRTLSEEILDYFKSFV